MSHVSQLLHSVWADERGFLVSSELIIIVTILVIGLIVGLTCVQSAVIGEFRDIGFAISSLNQSFRINGFRGCKGSFFAGSGFIDQGGACANGQCNSDFGFNGTGGFGIGGGYGVTPNLGGGVVTPGAPGMHLDLPAPGTPTIPQTTTPCPAGAPCDTGVGTCTNPGDPGCGTCPTGNCGPETLPLEPLPETQPLPSHPPMNLPSLP